MRLTKPVCVALVACIWAAADAAPDLHGAGWMQFGRIENSYAIPGSANNYDENWLGNFGGMVSSSITVDEHWEAGLGILSLLTHLPRGSKAEADIWYPFWVGFLNEARFTYSSSDFAEEGGMQLVMGAQPYNYNPDAKNLGVHLLKGYVYPGTLVSGFADLFGVPSTRTGIMGRFRKEGFNNDLMVNLETEDKPFYDISVANIFAWRLHPSFEFGAGVNFYRVLAANKDATSPGKDCVSGLLGPYAGSGPGNGQDNPCYILEKDPVTNAVDTITGSLSGTKLMARMRIDPKVWFGSPDALGPNDLVLYGEAAVLGLKNYPVLYDNILRRIPIMLGLNLPTFRLFDLSVEMEYYASNNSSDNLPPQNGSWLPALQTDPDVRRDDWKWSVNAARVVLGNIFVGAQVANDHLRLGGTHNTATGQEAMRTPQDWYWAFKTAYFF